MDKKDNWLYKLYNLKVSQVILIIVAIIFITPLLYNIPAPFNYIDFTDKGQIGDTIGGITAPFLNGLAALLVFVAFKVQIEANKQITNQNRFNTINDYVNRIEDDKFNFEKLHENFNGFYFDAINDNYVNSTNFILNLRKLIYVVSQFEQCLKFIGKLEDERDRIESRIYNLYSIVF